MKTYDTASVQQITNRRGVTGFAEPEVRIHRGIEVAIEGKVVCIVQEITKENKMARYENPWYRSCGKYGPRFYETDAKPVEYCGYKIYERIFREVWDVVKDGICITQRAGINGAKEAINEIIEVEKSNELKYA